MWYIVGGGAVRTSPPVGDVETLLSIELSFKEPRRDRSDKVNFLRPSTVFMTFLRTKVEHCPPIIMNVFWGGAVRTSPPVGDVEIIILFITCKTNMTDGHSNIINR